MPNIKSAKKRVKVIATKTMQNKAINSQLKTEIKKANAAIANGDEGKDAAVRVAIKKIDQAAAKGDPSQEYRCQKEVRPCQEAERWRLRAFL